MTSAIMFKDKDVWGSNGVMEDILAKLIKHSPEGSRLLSWSIQHYRSFYPGAVCDLGEAVENEQEILEWKKTIRSALDQVRSERMLTDRGEKWLSENRELLIGITDQC